MTEAKDKIRNVILCEDIREEIGNKKSLMGVLGGDIVVPAFPANIQIAVYFEYVPDLDEVDRLIIEFKLWHDQVEIAQGVMEATIEPNKMVTLVLPRGYTSFEKEMTFRMTAAVRGGSEFEILSKKIIKGAAS